MPLIMVTGLPTSGKTTRARQLYDYLSCRISSAPDTTPSSPRQYRLHLISDAALSISRAVYDLSPSQLPAHTRSANASEKDARASIYAAVKRVLSDRDIVILDGMNYIKGWRYQLFCEAKAVRTPSVVLQIGCPVETARRVNEERLARSRARAPTQRDFENREEEIEQQKDKENGTHKEEDGEQEGYEPENWDNLVFRYEEPNAMTRWDSPLFALIWDDDQAQAQEMFSRIWDAIAGVAKPTVRPNAVTLQRTRDAGANYLYVLEKETQDIVRQIVDAARDGGVQDVRIQKEDGDEDLTVELGGASVNLGQLQRIRRAYVALNRGGIGLENMGNLGVNRIRQSFVGYLNDHFAREA